MQRRIRNAGAALSALALLAACDATEPVAFGSPDVPTAAARVALETCAFGQTFTLAEVNSYYPVATGNSWLYEGEEDDTPVRLEIEVPGDTELVGGVTTLVLVETESAFDAEAGEWELIEVSRNFFAMTLDGTVCYFGEAVDIYEDGEIVSHEGEWRADDEGSHAGVFMPADPRPGMSFQMELAPGVAEDEGKIVGSGSVTVPAGTFEDAIRLREHNPLDGDKGYKHFASGVGMIVDGPLELIEYSTP